MRQGGLRDKIARAVAPEGVPGGPPLRPRPAPQTADLVNALARSLQEIAVRTAEPPPLPSAAGPAGAAYADPAEPAEMPQILQPRRMTPAAAGRDAQRGWRIGQIIAPAVLVLALTVVAGLMFAPAGSVDKLASAAKQSAAGQSPSGKHAALFSSLAGAEREAGWGSQRPPLSVEDVILLDRAEALLLRGEVEAARRLLSEAADGGSLNARFALAETFDPNILAARGMRSPVADASTARTLYAQALAAGDARAQRRLEGLQPGR